MAGERRTDLVRQPAAWALGALACLVLVVLSVAFLDRPVSRFSHDVLGRNPIVHSIQEIPEHLARFAVVIAAVLGLLRLFGARLGRPLQTLFGASLSLIVAGAITYYVKPVFGRAWPETFVQNNPSFIQNDVYGFFWFHGGAGWASFPSGHTVSMVAFVTVIARAYPRMLPVCAAAGAVEILSLLAMNYHFVGDTIGGAFLGGAVGLATAALLGLDGARAA